MSKRTDWEQFQSILENNNITKLYHFTDSDNLASIIQNGGLYSWSDCKEKGITIAKPGGSDGSRSLDLRDNLQNYVRLSFNTENPMKFVAMNEGRITNPITLEIDTSVIYDSETKYSDRNATKNGAKVGGSLEDFKNIHFSAVKARRHFDLDDDEKQFFQAEVLVKNFIPLSKILNIENFGIHIPSQPTICSKEAYTAQITRNTPTAFIFLVDQSVSMEKTTVLNGQEMTMAEAVARIVNNQINELVLRCIKSQEVRHYYDIAVLGYGEECYSGWEGELSGRDFVSPEELKNNPFKKITIREEKRTRKGPIIKEVEKVQWISACHSGSWTHLHTAFSKAKELLEQWMEKYHDKDCYPPTIINITDGWFNGASQDEVMQLANELKAMHTNDGNVLLFNIHISEQGGDIITFPTSKTELNDKYSLALYDLSSLLPLRYNAQIAKIRNDDTDVRHVAMAVNADNSSLIQLMDIGTPTNISQNI